MNKYIVNQKEFLSVPGAIICYWLSDRVLAHFRDDKRLNSYGVARQGLSTSDNNRFLRFWYEVSINLIDFNCDSCEGTISTSFKWFPYNKAGNYRKWSSINEYVVNYQDDGHEIKDTVMKKYPYLNGPGFVVKNTDYYFRAGLTWNDVSTDSFCCRYVPKGFIFADAGPMFFCSDMFYFMAFFNSVVFQTFADVICQGLHYSTGHIPQIPHQDVDSTTKEQISKLSQYCYEVSKKEWDSFEVSWNFKKHPLI